LPIACEEKEAQKFHIPMKKCHASGSGAELPVSGGFSNFWFCVFDGDIDARKIEHPTTRMQATRNERENTMGSKTQNTMGSSLFLTHSAGCGI
jgi:hypothetical protein